MVLRSHRHTSPPYTHVFLRLSLCPIGHRTQDVHGAQGTVAPETFLNGRRNPWVDTKPLAKRTIGKENSCQTLDMESPKPWSEELARLAAGTHLHYKGAAV